MNFIDLFKFSLLTLREGCLSEEYDLYCSIRTRLNLKDSKLNINGG